MQRDTQRSKVYKAESVLDKPSKKFETIKEVEKYLKRIFDSVWFKKNFPHKKQFKVGDGRRRRSASGGHWGNSGVRMSLPKWSRYESLVLHELAHGLTPLQYAWHGPEFCCVYLRLVEQYMGKEAHQLLQFSFRDNDVRSIWFKPVVNEIDRLLGLPDSKEELFK